MSHKRAGYIYADCTADYISCLPDWGGPYIFAATSFSTALSSIASASSRSSRAFASDTPVTPGQLAGLGSRFGLLQHRNDLLFREPQSLHRPSFHEAGV